MPNLQLACTGAPGIAAAIHFQGRDANGQPAPVFGTATIDDYASAFVTYLGSDGFQVVPKIAIAPGQPPKTVTVTLSPVDSASQEPLPPVLWSTDLVGAAQVAVAVVVTNGPVAVSDSGATDPGSATVSFSLA
jgi:hypothetical protein